LSGASYRLKVAVVRTIEPFEGKCVQSIPLIDMGHYIAPGTIGTISGWGIVVSLSDLLSGVINARFRVTIKIKALATRASGLEHFRRTNE
jgi:hypothetical protein